MPWTEEHLDRIRDRLSMAKRQGVWLSGEDIWVLLDLIRFWHRSTRLVGQNGVARGPLPTIGDGRTQGIAGVIVTCRRQGCGNRRRLAWGDLGLPETTIFVEIGRVRRFRCTGCQGCQVIVSADWPTPKMGLGDN